MNEVEKEVLRKFLSLLVLHPDADVYFLWVQAGGKFASQQKFAPDPPSACPDCGSVDPQVHFSNCPLAKTAGR